VFIFSKLWAGTPGEYGFGYYLANIIIFAILQPALILLFFILWRKEKKKTAINENISSNRY
jgi:hypothetical protein